MPEIKNQFTGGKMNKDLDERLVPNGEYRHAMNIQVATSEGSDVGTAQNILGNERIKIVVPHPIGVSTVEFNVPDSAQVVGCISDEKIDTMYYLVSCQDVDFILSWKNGDNSPLFIFYDENKDVLKFPRDNIITGINVIDGMLFWTDNVNEPRKINIEQCKEGTKTLSQTRLVNRSTGVDYFTNPPIFVEEKHITVIKKAPQVAPRMMLKTHRDRDKIYTAVVEISPTNDGTSSFVDSSSASYSNTAIPFNFSSFSTDEGSNAFALSIDKGLNMLGEEVGFPIDPTTSNTLLDLTGVVVAADVYSLNGKAVVLQAYNIDSSGNQNPPGLPLTDFVMKGKVISVGSDKLVIKLTSIDGFPDVASDAGNLKYVVDFYDPQEKLFEFKYPRFSYRYKFKDGEYSPFAPFTQVAFSPGAFDYHPRKGYNIGMTNRLSGVELFDIVTEQTPVDVVSIDILFKDDASPSVYVVDTIKPNDYSVAPLLNVWNTMLQSSIDNTLDSAGFTIEKEAISSIVPSNQLLRPWDNVPKKALAQDVTGNRVVYANYYQNYNLETTLGNKYVPGFTFEEDSFSEELLSSITGGNSQLTQAFKSIKSLREYQLGVVFLDEYGRETPVLSNATAIKKYTKKDGDKANRIGLQFSSDDYPQSLTHFKFYIKETSSEYYNMAMDRWYSAGDGNIWLAFPSSDRNKIDIDTFLILKKGSDQDILVQDPARYKVLAIENEAPDFIKTTKRKAVSIKHNATITSKDVFGGFGFLSPFEGLDEFNMNYLPFFGTSGGDIASVDDELWIEFGKSGEDTVSDRYRVVSITNSYDGTTLTGSNPPQFSIKLADRLGADVNFITDDETGVSSSFIENGAIVNVYKYKVENLDRFDGRFFVKIYFDETFRKNIETTVVGGGVRIASSKKVYSMDSLMVEKHTEDLGNFLLKNDSRAFSKKTWQDASSISGIPIPPPNYNQPSSFLDSWQPNDTAGNSYDTRNLCIYGYYNVHEFTANALYFRKYNVIEYRENDHIGVNYGKEQYGLSAPSSTTGTTNAIEWLNEENFEALVHLKNGGTANDDDAIGYPLADGSAGTYEPADDWHEEFGYRSTNSAIKNLAEMDDTQQGKGGTGVTASWFWNGDPAGFTSVGDLAYSSYYHEHNTEKQFKSDRDSARDNEVWFIDKGPADGRSDWWDGNDLDSSYWNDSASNKFGIDAGGNSWKMYLSFGGLLGHEPDTSNAGKGFWLIGDWNNSQNETSNRFYDDQPTKKFINRLNPDYKFRWKEDKTQTEYTINSVNNKKNDLRHSWGKHNLHEVNNDYNAKSMNLGSTSGAPVLSNKEQFGTQLDSMAENLSFNRTKGWVLDGCTPALGFNVSEPGIIPGGLSLEIAAISEDGSSTGNTVEGADILSSDLKIFVRTLGNGQKPLHLGMMLTNYTHSTGAQSPTNLTIRYIEKKEDTSGTAYYALWLGGYEYPLVETDHEGLIDEPPTLGSSLIFKQVGMNGYSPNSEFNINTIGRTRGLGAITAVFYTLEVIDEIQPTEVLSENPAIFETEPKESTALDIYYEASGTIPAIINEKTVASGFPVGTRFIIITLGGGSIFIVVGHDGNTIKVRNADLSTATVAPIPSLTNPAVFNRPDDLIINAKIITVVPDGTNQWAITVEENLVGNKFTLPWHNCYSFGNGVESNRIRDNFNLPFISNGVKASTTLEQEYEEEHRKYGLIYSGIYNSTSGINNLNQFIAGEKITKDINPIYGSIQKLYSRDSDLVTLCEDKILRISANKDALFNADGNPQLIATDRVLGQTIPFSGEYGISTNPESFASESYRAYFTDRTRGVVIRMSKDGLTPISDAGMKDYFRDNLRNATQLIGSYDDRNGEYNISIKINPTYPVKIISTGPGGAASA